MDAYISFLTAVIALFAIVVSIFSLWIQYFEKPKIEVRLVRKSNGHLKTENCTPKPHVNSDGKEIHVPLEAAFFLEIRNVGRTACGISSINYERQQEVLVDQMSVKSACIDQPLRDCYLLRRGIAQVRLNLRLPQNCSNKCSYNCRYSIVSLKVEGPFDSVSLDEKDLVDMNAILSGSSASV